jgi:RND family efflux transporter MFP subunit
MKLRLRAPGDDPETCFIRGGIGFGRYLCTLLVLSMALSDGCSSSKASPAPPPPPVVSVITVHPENVSLSTEWIATLDGYVNAQIRPQVSGYLVRRDYEEGAIVSKDQVMFEIDARPSEAVLAQTQARLSEAQAQLGKTARDLERDRPLAAQRAIAQSQLDNDIQADLAAQASIKSATAAVDTAQLNLGFTKVTSLITGVAAIATAQIGDLVGPATLLTTVSQIDPIKAYFPLGEQDYLRMAGRINGRTTSRQPWMGQTGLTLILGDGIAHPHRGSFLAADREIDPKTGTIRISATFPNPTHTLRPGQYGRVRAETETVEGAILVPQRAVTELQGSYQLRLVTPDNHVTTRTVELGDRVGSRWIVAKGLKADERVVVEGSLTRDGTVVSPKPFVPPGGDH